MNIEFKIRNVCTGEKQTWNGALSRGPFEDFVLDDGNDAKDFYRNVLLCDVTTDYRKLAREEPIFTELIRIPTDLRIVEELLRWWDDAPEDWRKSFVFLYQELGDYSVYSAMKASSEFTWTGAKYNGDSEEESLEALGRYYAGALGVAECLSCDKVFDFTKFGKVQLKRSNGTLTPCLTFGEWVETGDYPDVY